MLGMIKGGATYIAVATDHVIESFRNGLWPGDSCEDRKEPEGVEGEVRQDVWAGVPHCRMQTQSRFLRLPQGCCRTCEARPGELLATSFAPRSQPGACGLVSICAPFRSGLVTLTWRAPCGI